VNSFSGQAIDWLVGRYHLKSFGNATDDGNKLAVI